LWLPLSSILFQALSLLDEWKPIDIDDALELLSRMFPNDGIRQYAVRRLATATDDELLSYLLQLVQALKYEKHYPSPLSEYDVVSCFYAFMSLVLIHLDYLSFFLRFLLNRAIRSFEMANYFHWYVTVETEDLKYGEMYRSLHADFLQELKSVCQEKARGCEISLLCLLPFSNQLRIALKCFYSLWLCAICTACRGPRMGASARSARCAGY
jgi:phosphatidylinositol 3-kinase